MTTTPLPDAPVRSADELTERWATLLAPPLFDARSLWLAWLDTDGVQFPVVVPVDDLPALPSPDVLRNLLHLHAAVTERSGFADGHLALALCRPGAPTVTEDDDEWAEALREEFDAQVEGTWSLHLAAGGSVVPLVSPPRWRRG